MAVVMSGTALKADSGSSADVRSLKARGALLLIPMVFAKVESSCKEALDMLKTWKRVKNIVAIVKTTTLVKTINNIIFFLMELFWNSFIVFPAI